MTCFCLLSCVSPVSPEIIQAPQSLTVNVTDTAQFNCTVLSYPALNYLQWYFLDTNRLLNIDRLIVIMHSSEINATDGTVILSSVLNIVGITLSDAGKYQCRAGVPNFPPVNVTATLTVQCEFLILIFLLLLILFAAPPIVQATSNNVIGIITRQITLKFNITGDTPLVTPSNIHWQFNGTDLVGGDTAVFSDDRFSVTLSNLSLSDEGFYIVTASNPAGSDMDSLFLDVEGKRLLLVILTFFSILLQCLLF